MVTLDSGASVSVISRNFSGLSDIVVDKISHSLQLFNASGQEMIVNVQRDETGCSCGES